MPSLPYQATGCRPVGERPDRKRTTRNNGPSGPIADENVCRTPQIASRQFCQTVIAGFAWPRSSKSPAFGSCAPGVS